jgi:hypothetical protein
MTQSPASTSNAGRGVKLPRVRLASLIVGSLAALSCARSGLEAGVADAGAAPPACAARAGDPCCAGPDGGAPTCGSADLACAGAACTCLAQVTAVYDTTPLVRRVDGSVWVALDRARFTEILGPSGRLRATDIAASGSTAYGTAVGCAIVDGGVWCFPLAGPLLDSTDLGAGLGPGVMTSAAVRVVTAAGGGAPLADARQLSATMNGGGAAFCAVTTAGAIWCWGYGVSGILGRGDQADSTYARPVLAGPSGAPFADATEVRLGFDSACARKTDGSVWCWGASALGQIGVADSSGLPPGTAGPTPYPEGPLLLSGAAVRLAANPGNTHCAIVEGGEVACWGWNVYAQAGTAASMSTNGTALVFASQGSNLPLAGIVDLAPDRGMQAMCATTSSGALLCWGHPFPPPGATDATSPYPTAIPLARAGGAPLRLPLSSYGGRDGSLVYVDPDGKLTFEAGGFPFAAQPPCDDASP